MHREQESKSIPCHVVKVEKDFIHVAFETKNSIFTPPVMKMTQNFSRFGREPTQVGDKGHANPGDYYMGGNTAFAGGGTNFYPRGNLSTLSFQPLANLKAPQRDYDQHHETGGPHGWKVRTMEKQQEQQQQGGQSGTSDTGGGGAQTARAHAMIMSRRNFMAVAVQTAAAISALSTGSSSTSSTGSTGNGQQSQQQKDADEQEKSKTEVSFDKDGKVLLQSVDQDHYHYVDQKNKTIKSQSQKVNQHQVKDEKWSVRVDDKHVHIRFEDNRIWVDKNGCWSSKPIQVKQDPNDS
jgi:hypothetical protein